MAMIFLRFVLDSFVWLLQLIVATEKDEIPRLDALFERGKENGVRDLRVIGPDEIKDIEPNCVVGGFSF